MLTNFEMVKAFHTAFGQPVRTAPVMPNEAEVALRCNLIEEEYEEYLLAHTESEDNNKNLVSIADALTDLLYVVYGAGLYYGIDLDKCFDVVHLSNMSKLGEDGKPIHRADGKVLKGPNFFKPNLKDVLFPKVDA